ncbi:MAG: hypothetical protein ACREFC_12160, partial [Stellaceae bacterium]
GADPSLRRGAEDFLTEAWCLGVVNVLPDEKLGHDATDVEGASLLTRIGGRVSGAGRYRGRIED